MMKLTKAERELARRTGAEGGRVAARRLTAQQRRERARAGGLAKAAKAKHEEARHGKS